MCACMCRFDRGKEDSIADRATTYRIAEMVGYSQERNPFSLRRHGVHNSEYNKNH